MTANETNALDGRGDPAGRPSDNATDAELRAAGWQRCFVADEPRLSEAVETYREIGFEVLVLPVRMDDAACTECMRQAQGHFRVIYVRKALDL